MSETQSQNIASDAVPEAAWLAWSDAIEFASTESARQIAIALAQAGAKAPDLLGEELYNEQVGVYGEIEFGWCREQIALLTAAHLPARESLIRSGWQVLLIDHTDPVALAVMIGRMYA